MIYTKNSVSWATPEDIEIFRIITDDIYDRVDKILQEEEQ